MENIDGLIRENPIQARAEILKHLDGELAIRSLGGEKGQRRFDIFGLIKSHSLLAVNQEAGCATMVAGERFGRGASSPSAGVIEFSFRAEA
jgi:hypothetical protein